MAKDFAAERQRMRGLCLAASDLIDELDKRYQFKPPAMEAPDRQIWRSAGARDVVELLLTLRAEAQGNDPMGKVLNQ